MPDKTDYREAKNFKAFRKFKGLTQDEMGKIVGKSQEMVQRYETGNYLIPGRVVSILVKKLNMSHDWFYHNKGPMEAGKPEKATLVTEISALRTENRLLELRVEKLESDFKILAASISRSKVS